MSSRVEQLFRIISVLLVFVISSSNAFSVSSPVKSSTVRNDDFTVSNRFSQYSFDDTLVALQVYYDHYGNLALPRRYVISMDAQMFAGNDLEDDGGRVVLSYPNKFAGVDLSKLVYNLKWWKEHVRGRPERVKRLNEIGFIWTRLQDEWNLFVEALCTYVYLNGNTMVPISFVVPSNDYTWSIDTWGMPLGNIVNRIRLRGDYLRGKPDRVRQMHMLCFVWDVKEYKFLKFYAALKFYRDHVQDWSRDKILKVPSSFVVPENDLQWPKELRGYPLGVKCQAIRQKEIYVKDNPERKLMLNQLGFQFTPNTDIGWLKTIHAAAIYSQIHDRVLDVPLNFVVPEAIASNGNDDDDYCSIYGCYEENWIWPEHLWGLPLGVRLRDVRRKGAYLKNKDTARSRIAQLNALGFVWKPKRGRKTYEKEAQKKQQWKILNVEQKKHYVPDDDNVRSIFTIT